MKIHFSETVVFTQHLEEETDVSSYLFIHLFFFRPSAISILEPLSDVSQ